MTLTMLLTIARHQNCCAGCDLGSGMCNGCVQKQYEEEVVNYLEREIIKEEHYVKEPRVQSAKVC